MFICFSVFFIEKVNKKVNYKNLHISVLLNIHQLHSHINANRSLTFRADCTCERSKYDGDQACTG